jgi:hypothetical protein
VGCFLSKCDRGRTTGSREDFDALSLVTEHYPNSGGLLLSCSRLLSFGLLQLP